MRERIRFFLAASCAAALCIVTRANAQEVETFSWTGFYIGGNVGGLSSHYGFGAFTDEVDVDAQFAQLEFNGTKLFGPVTDVSLIDIDLDDFGIAEFSFPGAGPGFSTFNDGSDQSILGGVQIGYNKQFGHFVVGIEGDFQGTSASKGQLSSGFIETDNLGLGEPPIPQGPFIDEFGETTLTAERRAETCWTASLRARLGYAVGPILFYGTAGVAFTEVNVTAIETASTDFFEEGFIDEGVAAAARPVTNGINGDGNFFIGNVTSTNVSKSSSDDVEVGWTGGVGSAWAINKIVSLGVEYRHSDYGSRTYHFTSNENIIFPGDTKVSLETDQVTLRVNFLISNFFGH